MLWTRGESLATLVMGRTLVYIVCLFVLMFYVCCRHPACWKGDLNLVCLEGECQCRDRMAWEAR